MWCSASYFSAIFDATGVSSTLFANFIETALIFRSGFVLRSKDKTNVESNAHYSAYLEYGTSKMEPRPFMFPAFEKSRKPIEQAVFKRVVKKIEEMTKWVISQSAYKQQSIML